MRRYYGLFRPSGAFSRHRFSADYYITSVCVDLISDMDRGNVARLPERLELRRLPGDYGESFGDLGTATRRLVGFVGALLPA